ncbi:MAG: DUF262 domain-containing protein [Myxococcales bacterium]|nr:DUF262 domain-containing protein [Myxococcales bacterium]MDD9964678.1 DUF262 domain-containing protein [Myxococcales bacterium]
MTQACEAIGLSRATAYRRLRPGRTLAMPTDRGCRIGDTRAVIDGQQRLTTIVLFFKVLFEAQGDAKGFGRHFHNSVDDLCLRHNHADAEIFEAIARYGPTDELRASYKDNRVLQAFDFFRSQRDSISGIDVPALLSRVYFVGIDLNSDEDEQQIFDTINSLGGSLSVLSTTLNTAIRDSAWADKKEGRGKHGGLLRYGTGLNIST